MTTPYTPEERERAAEQIRRLESAETHSAAYITALPEWTLNLQMRLNRLERREAEARYLLEFRSGGAPFSKEALDRRDRLDAWLSEEGV